MIEKTKNKCEHNVNTTIKLLTSLGFIINKKKCQLIPDKKCTFLGFVIDSKNYCIYLTDKKKEKILKILNTFYKQKSCKIREAAQLIGTLISACSGTKYGFLYTRQLERSKYLALLKFGNNFKKKMLINSEMRADIKWWIKNLTKSRNYIRDNVYKYEIFSDASLTGWGATYQGKKVIGWWSAEESKEHINVLELKAAFYALKCFGKNIHDEELLFRIDNTTAIAYINKMGGIQHAKLQNLSKNIWEWCEKRNIWIFACYINTKENEIADHESCKMLQETEWELAR